jgi:DNA-binding NarL/FixJ family response regulator
MPQERQDTISIIIVEDEDLYRDLLVNALSSVPTFHVVAALADANEAEQRILDTHPDVATLDIELPGGVSGMQVGLSVKNRQPGIGIVWLSNHAEPYFAISVAREITAGWAYLLKKSVSDIGSLVRAIEGAARGLVVLDPEIVRGVPKKIAGDLASLTPRQREILAQMAQGFTNAGIAQGLYITEKSVENQINQIYQRLEIDRQNSAVQPRVRAVLKYLDAVRK